MLRDIKHIPEAWTKAFCSSAFRNQFFITLMVFGAVSFHDFHYLRIWQLRHGMQVNDILLNQLPPHDFSAPIFFFEYSTLILVFLISLTVPQRLTQALQVFAVIILARTMSIYFVPLEPPRDMIDLNDPVATFFLHTKDVFVTKDLFFSGHIAALSLFFLFAHNKYIRIWAGISTAVVACMLLSQHVHYTLDVLFAPIASFIAYKIVLYLHRDSRFGLNVNPQEISSDIFR